MKQTILIPGLLSTLALSFGITFKFLHWPGANIIMGLGMTCLSFVFLPMLLLQQIKENKPSREKKLTGFALIAALLISVGTIFKMLHFPTANIQIVLGFSLLSFAFLPMLFYHMYKQSPSAK